MEATETKEPPAVVRVTCMVCGESLDLPLRRRGRVFVYKAECPVCHVETKIRGVQDR